MKIIVQNKKIRSVSLRISDETMKKIDKLAKQHKVSRQLLVESILEKAMITDDFEIKVSKIDLK